jgi:hypothetical protein
MKTKIIRSILVSISLLGIFAGVSRSQTGLNAGDTLCEMNIGNTIYGLGLNFSPVSGYGVAAKAHFASRFSLMATGYVTKTSGETFYNYGLELQYDLLVRDRARLFLLAGASHYYDENLDFTNGPQNSTDHLGVGFGFELSLMDDGLCVDASLELMSNQPSGDLNIYPAAGMHYYFH